jgi:NAD(P)H-flavin reductase
MTEVLEMAPPLAAAPAAPDPMLPVSYVVERTQRETADTFTLELLPQGGGGFTFGPGQFNMLYVFGIGEVPISISGDPAFPQRLVHTTRVVGAVTRGMGALRRGEPIGVRGPFGTRWPVEAASGCDVVVVAGGIGLAPLRPALYEILSRRERFGRVVLLYGARTPDDILYRKQLHDWRGDFDLDVHVTVDRATSAWRGNVGVVTTLIPRVPFDPYNTVAMVCGPEMMMRFTVLELERRGVPAAKVWLSLERNMKCGVGLCGHCQCGPRFICRDGPVFPCVDVWDLMSRREL